MSRNRTVPRPEKNRVVAGGKPVIIGTEEGCAEHCNHVLRANADSNRPGEALVPGRRRNRLNASTVAVNRPVKAEKFERCSKGAPEVNVVCINSHNSYAHMV